MYVYIVEKGKPMPDKKSLELMKQYRTYCPITSIHDLNGYEEITKDIDLEKFNVIIFKKNKAIRYGK